MSADTRKHKNGGLPKDHEDDPAPFSSSDTPWEEHHQDHNNDQRIARRRTQENIDEVDKAKVSRSQDEMIKIPKEVEGASQIRQGDDLPSAKLGTTSEHNESTLEGDVLKQQDTRSPAEADPDENDSTETGTEDVMQSEVTGGQAIARPKESRQCALQKRWDKMFEKLIAFRESHGHCLVPNRYDVDRSLGAWVSAQRRHYKANMENLGRGKHYTPLTLERVRRLEEIGFAWATTDPRRTPWEIRFKQLCEYRESFGDCLVPIGFSENLKLANWVSTQRQEYRAFIEGRPSSITVQRIQLLNSIGMVWDAQRAGNRQRGRYKPMSEYMDVTDNNRSNLPLPEAPTLDSSQDLKQGPTTVASGSAASSNIPSMSSPSQGVQGHTYDSEPTNPPWGRSGIHTLVSKEVCSPKAPASAGDPTHRRSHTGALGDSTATETVRQKLERSTFRTPQSLSQEIARLFPSTDTSPFVSRTRTIGVDETHQLLQILAQSSGMPGIYDLAMLVTRQATMGLGSFVELPGDRASLVLAPRIFEQHRRQRSLGRGATRNYPAASSTSPFVPHQQFPVIAASRGISPRSIGNIYGGALDHHLQSHDIMGGTLLNPMFGASGITASTLPVRSNPGLAAAPWTFASSALGHLPAAMDPLPRDSWQQIVTSTTTSESTPDLPWSGAASSAQGFPSASDWRAASDPNSSEPSETSGLGLLSQVSEHVFPFEQQQHQNRVEDDAEED